MDYLKKQLETIQQNLAGLNATQKMLTGALVVIMAMTMVYWSRYAGTAEMEPVLNQSLSDEDVTRMSASLESRGITTKVEAGKVLVAADRKMQALAVLGYEQLLPRNTANGFDQMYAKGGPFTSPSQQEDLKNHGRELTLAQVIGAFPGVSNAVVMIDPTYRRQIGDGSITPTANINISMRSGSTADNKLVNAAADLVCGAVAGMNKAKIKVVVDGRPRQINDGGEDGGMDSSGQLAAKNEFERSIQRKIENQLGYINGVVVSVDGMLNTSTQEERSTINDEKNTLILAEHTDTTSSETTSNQGGSNEPGALANVGGASVAGAGGNSSQTTETREKVDNKIIPSSTQKTIKRPAGDYTTLSASVRVPRTYFVGVLKARNGGKEPADADLQDYIKVGLADIKSAVRACTNIKKEEDIVVGTYDEIAPTVAAASIGGGSSTGSSGVTGIIGGWGKEVGVGALAVVSLFMVSTMVKRSTPAPLVVAAAPKNAPSALQSGEDVAGFASEGSSTLAGMELDDDAMQAQQVIDQVTSLVGENPDGAATLVKRWLNR